MVNPSLRYSCFCKISQILSLNECGEANFWAIYLKFSSVIDMIVIIISCNFHPLSMFSSHFIGSQREETQKVLFLAIFGHFFESGVKSTFHSHLIFLLCNLMIFFCPICEGQLNLTFQRTTVAVLKISPWQNFFPIFEITAKQDKIRSWKHRIRILHQILV